MKITFRGGELLLKVLPAIGKMHLDAGKTYDLEIVEHRHRRSLDANAYCWVLIDALSAKIGRSPKDIYRDMIKDVGGNCQVVCVRNKDLKMLVDGWQNNGLGWIAEPFESHLPNCTNVRLFLGSSKYNTAQMSRLIDLVVQECRQQDIETDTPEEIARLLDDKRIRHKT